MACRTVSNCISPCRQYQLPCPVLHHRRSPNLSGKTSPLCKAMLALQRCIKQIFLFLLLWCKLGRPLTPLKEVNAMLPYCQHQHLCGQLKPWEPSSRIHCSQPTCVCLVVDEITWHWKNLDVVQSKKWTSSKLPIISRKLAIQTKYLPKNQKHRLLYNSDFFFWHVFSTDMAILIKEPQAGRYQSSSHSCTKIAFLTGKWRAISPPVRLQSLRAVHAVLQQQNWLVYSRPAWPYHVTSTSPVQCLLATPSTSRPRGILLLSKGQESQLKSVKQCLTHSFWFYRKNTAAVR